MNIRYAVRVHKIGGRPTYHVKANVVDYLQHGSYSQIGAKGSALNGA